MTNYATSTVAMSIYNWIAVNGRMVRDADCLSALSLGQLPGLGRDLFDLAVTELILRKLLTGDEKTGYDIVDERRQIFISRDRSDADIDEETGEITGGWNGWVPYDRTLGACVLREARP
jgi:hypothetical protein